MGNHPLVDRLKSPCSENKLQTVRNLFGLPSKKGHYVFSLDHSDNNGTNEAPPVVFPPSVMPVQLGKRVNYFSGYKIVV